jgi:hypothetical protein
LSPPSMNNITCVANVSVLRLESIVRVSVWHMTRQIGC